MQPTATDAHHGRDYKTTVAVIAAIVAFVSALIAGYAYAETRRANLDAAVSRSMSEYLSSFSDISGQIDGQGNPFYRAEDYVGLRPALKKRLQILNGQLVQVVDAMYDAGDCRRHVWAEFLRGFGGPAKAGYPVEGYAKRAETKRAIEAARSLPDFPMLR